MFKALGQDEMSIVVNAMEEVKFEEGAVVITEGEPGNVLYIVEEGRLDCFKKVSADVSIILIVKLKLKLLCSLLERRIDIFENICTR